MRCKQDLAELKLKMSKFYLLFCGIERSHEFVYLVATMNNNHNHPQPIRRHYHPKLYINSACSCQLSPTGPIRHIYPLEIKLTIRFDLLCTCYMCDTLT